MSTNTQDKVTFGFWVYLMSDCVLFAGLFATYAVLQNATYGGPAIYDITSLPFVLGETMFLLTSSFTVGLAVLAAYKNKKTLTLLALFATLVLGLAFLGMEITEFRHLIAEGSGPSRSAFLSAFFALVGTHGTHVFFGSIWMLVLMAHLIFKGTTPGATRKLLCLSLFWHFLDIIWIFIFTLVYLTGVLAL
jgi:cytochrome o ubiquinol oxidase subunit 3